MRDNQKEIFPVVALCLRECQRTRACLCPPHNIRRPLNTSKEELSGEQTDWQQAMREWEKWESKK